MIGNWELLSGSYFPTIIRNLEFYENDTVKIYQIWTTGESLGLTCHGIYAINNNILLMVLVQDTIRVFGLDTSYVEKKYDTNKVSYRISNYKIYYISYPRYGFTCHLHSTNLNIDSLFWSYYNPLTNDSATSPTYIKK